MREVTQHAKTGLFATGQARRQQVATGGRLPVEHLAGAKNPWQFGEHQIRLHRLKPHAAGAADGLVNGPRRCHRDGQGLDGGGQLIDIGHLLPAKDFVEQSGLDAVDVQAAFEMTR